MDQIANILDDIHADLKPAFVPAKDKIEEKIEECIVDSPGPDILKIQSELYAIKNRLEQLIDYVNSGKGHVPKPIIANEVAFDAQEPNIIEGVFSGEKMIGPDGKEYAVSANYASKSKLVEGDIMKLTIKNDGSFLYKQIGPIARKRIMGKLEYDSENQKWTVNVEGIHYKILTASVTFYKGAPNDEVIILVPESSRSDWGAVENIISR